MESRKLAFIFPGQGAQYPGMGRDFYDHFPVARETFQEADDLLGQHFSKIIFDAPTEELALTRNSQLAIYIVSVAIWRTVLHAYPSLKAVMCAGLSLGEYTALTAAGKISFSECLPLVKARALFMDDACRLEEGTMQVILGLDGSVVETVLSKVDPTYQVWAANFNSPGQVVIAGKKEGVAFAAELLKQQGAKRAISLDVSGAFHTPLMRSAQEKLEPYLLAASFTDTPIAVVTNVTGKTVKDVNEAKRRLVEQITSPVRWEAGVKTMAEHGITLFIEMGCGKTLSGMNKRIGVAAPTLSIEKIEDLESLSCNC